jgi:hypothetical protein
LTNFGADKVYVTMPLEEMGLHTGVALYRLLATRQIIADALPNEPFY